MNTLLIFFAIPVAVVILSIILETLLKNSCKVAGIFFSIFLVTVFAIGATAMYIALIIGYTVLSFITAYLVMLICSGRRIFPCYNNYYNSRCNYFEGDEDNRETSNYYEEQYSQNQNYPYRKYRNN